MKEYINYIASEKISPKRKILYNLVLMTVRTLTENEQEILNAMSCSYSNGVIEGTNNLIKVIKRIAFGYRSFVSFKIRILLITNTLVRFHNKRQGTVFVPHPCLIWPSKIDGGLICGGPLWGTNVKNYGGPQKIIFISIKKRDRFANCGLMFCYVCKRRVQDTLVYPLRIIGYSRQHRIQTLRLYFTLWIRTLMLLFHYLKV